MASIMATKVTESSLTCSICLRRFRKPRALPCLHSYCEECLVEYAPKGTHILMCPLCQEKIPIPDGDVTKFKLDFRLQSQVEDASRYEKEAGIVSEIRVCTCCKNEDEAIATCRKCGRLLCKFGVKAHENLAAFEDHKVIPLTDGDNAQLEELINKMSRTDKTTKAFPPEKRALLVSNIPDQKCSPERMRDRLAIHFLRKRNGGGDIDGILYPLEGCPQKAVIAFAEKEASDLVLQTDQVLEEFKAKVTVEPLPQVFNKVEADIDSFYWNLVPRLTTTKLIDEFSKTHGKKNLQTAGHILKKITCTMSQLDDVHSTIVRATGLPVSRNSYSVIERGMFVKNIPYLTDETEQLREELRKHLQVEGVCQLDNLTCPVKGNVNEAIALFVSPADREAFIGRSDKCFFGEALQVSRLPPVFRRMTAHLADFFLRLLQHRGIHQYRAKLQASCGQDIVVIESALTGNSEQLQKASTTILEIIGLCDASLMPKHLSDSDPDERSVLVEGIPCETNDAEQLKDHLKEYFQKSSNGGGKVDQIIFPIERSMSSAIVVFVATSDAVSTVKHGNHLFAGEDLEVSLLPPLFQYVTARCDDIYLKMLPKKSREKLRTAIEERSGSGLTCTQNLTISGSLRQICTGKEVIMEAVGIASTKEKQQQVAPERRSTQTMASSASDVEPGKSDTDTSTARDVPIQSQERSNTGTLKLSTGNESRKANSDIETLKLAQSTSNMSTNRDGDTARDGPRRTQGKDDTRTSKSDLDASMDSSSMYTRRDGATARDVPKDKKQKQTSDGKHVVKHPGKAQPHGHTGQFGIEDDKWDSQNAKQTSGRLSHQRYVDEDKQEGELGSTSKEKIRKPVDDEKQPSEHLPEGKKEKCSEKEKVGGGSGLGSLKDSKIEKEAEHEGAGSGLLARKGSRTGRGDEASSILNQSKDQEGAGQTSEEMSSSVLKQEDVDQCAKVDEVIFEYITTRCKDEYQAIQTKYGVSINATKPKGSCSSGKLIVEVKQLGRTRTRANTKTLNAQHDFIRLYSKVMADVVCKTLDCSGIKAEKITKAKAMMTKKFKDVLVHKVSNKEFKFCGEESIVADGMREFQITAGMIVEEDEYFSVDKIAFQYLKSMTSEVDSIEKKYNVYFDLKELKEASSDQQQAVYIKPRKSGNQKTKIKGNVTTQAKEDLISVYQSYFFALERIQLSCQDVSRGKIQEAVKVTKGGFPTVMIMKKEGSDLMLCGKEDVVQNAVKEFRRIAGLLPAGRKLKRSISTEGNQKNDDELSKLSVQSNEASAAEKTTSKSWSTNCKAEDLPYTFATKEGIQIIVLEGDITKQEVNIVVNAANSQLKHKGGVAKAIAQAAGPQLQKECDDLMRMRRLLQIAECVATRGYQLHCDHVIHTVGPIFNPKVETEVSTFIELLKKTFLNVLMFADGIPDVITIAVPLISSGNYGGPKEACTEALALALRKFSTVLTRKELQQVFLVNIDAQSTKALQQTLRTYFPSTTVSPQSPPTSKGMSNSQYPHVVRTLTSKEGLKITITTGDITTLKVDAIVNAANEHLRHGRGVAAAIATAAGSQLTDESEQIMKRRKQQPLQVGEIEETGSYKLPCKTVIHAVGPRYDTCPNKDVFHSMLKQTFSAVLKHANGRVESASLALPLISSGVFNGPKELCSKALVEAVKEFSESTPTLIVKSLYLINTDHEATKAVDGAFQTSFHTSRGAQGTSRSAVSGSKSGSHFVTPEGINIHVEQGDITKQRVDAIVNLTDTKLSHAGGVSKAILKAAGDKFKEECRDHLKHRVYLKPFEVVHTSGGNLPSSYILSVDSPHFERFHKETEYSSVLKDTIKACLHTANHSLKLASIALPVMGTGNSGTPPGLSILALANGIREMSRTEATLALNQIKVICVDQKTVDDVKSTFDNTFLGGNTASVKPEHVTIQTKGVSNQGASNATKPTNPIHPMSADNTQSSVIYQTTEGIRVEVDGRDFSALKVDVLFVAMDMGMRHNDEVMRKLEDAGGPMVMEEVRNAIKKRKNLKPGERIGTRGHHLPCNDIVHYVETTDAEYVFLALLLHGKTTLGAKSIAFVVDSISKSSTEGLVKAIKHFSLRLSKVNLLIHVVGINQESVSAATSAFTRHLPQISKATVRTSPSLTGVTFATGTPNQGHIHGEHGALPKSSSSSHLQSHRKAPTTSPPGGHSPTLKCQKCYTTTNVGKLESCSHTFCSDCIQRYMALTLACPECHEFYCVGVDKSLHGTMTAYRRTDMHVAGSSSPGAILIRYEFPAGTQGSHHPSPGKPYNGTTALAYLPCDSEGFMVARRLREAFVAGLTFTVKRKKSGRYEVGWSDEIPHKRSTRGGKQNNGFPDPDYMKRVNSALDKKLPPRHSADVSQQIK